jgi:hypothetical protein
LHNVAHRIAGRSFGMLIAKIEAMPRIFDHLKFAECFGW